MAGWATRDESAEITDINVTPLVDVTLVLLVIFMVTASLMLSRALPVKLPEAAGGRPAGAVTWQVVLIPGSRYELNGREVDASGLAAKLRAEVTLRPDLKVSLAADGRMIYQEVVAALDLLKAQGVRAVSLAVAAR